LLELFMKSARLIGFILAAMLLVICIAGAPAIAQQDEADALNKKAIELYQAGKFSEAMPLAQRALAVFEKALGPDYPNVAATLNTLGTIYTAQGRVADAEPLHRRALAIEEKTLGPDHPGVAPTLNNLAKLYDDQGRYADAEPFYRRALAIHEKARGPDHPRFANTLNNLAVLYALLPPRSLRRCRAALQAIAGDPRECARSRPSSCRDIAQRPR
jgi:tetratricopeptide (TPR) repeat protein